MTFNPTNSFRPAFVLTVVFAIAAGACVSGAAWAEKQANPVAVFAGLDKITARISSFDVAIGNTVQFGALRVTPKVCYTRPATETPFTTAFVEVDEIKLNNKIERIFSGWMFASSPALHAVEHPIFDVWLTNCKTLDGDASTGNLEKSVPSSSASSN